MKHNLIVLTVAQKDVVEAMLMYNGSLRKHKKPSGSECYRMVDDRMNPRMNFTTSVVDALENMYILVREDATLKLDRERLKDIHGYFTFKGLQIK